MLSENLFVRVSPGVRQELIVWLVFAACAIATGAGVAISFVVLGSTITEFKAWGLVFVITAVMLGIHYGVKFASAADRTKFSPMDLVQYVVHGFLWPAAWPTLADRFGIDKIDAPKETAPAAAHLIHATFSLIVTLV
ncbi:MAG TPA: hypothetical protein VMT90_04905 [Dehalococcoidia bacterium]|jgi:hypothetical protein|nr:hypothetical protein [Dehalococcoidia bacterium]